MNYRYQAVDEKGVRADGVVEAPSKDLALSALGRRGLIVTTIRDAEEKKGLSLVLFERIPMKDIVIMSRQISTLFEAQVSALKAFQLLATNTENPSLGKKLARIAEDLQAGSSISEALAKHPTVFSPFYVAMVRAGEESGKLIEVFLYLSEYLDRQYALNSKTKNALIYPAFVIGVFVIVMVLMFVMVIPKLSAIIEQSGQAVPFYTTVIIAMSNFMVHYGIFLLIGVVAVVTYLVILARRPIGKKYIDKIKITLPVIGPLFKKMYLARIADNMDTMLASGIPIIRAIEITGNVVGNSVYEEILRTASDRVKSGSTFSVGISGSPYMPQILIQMVKVGEETGSMGQILKTLARFYKREVDDAVDTLVGLIEPVMIVGLGLGVGILLTSVLMPIYNIAGGVS